MVATEDGKATFKALIRHIYHRGNVDDKQFAMKMSVKAAMRDRPQEAEPVIHAEILQLVNKEVFHPVRRQNLTWAQCKAILRSSMFLKEFEKFKARLVAGGDGQDKSLYDNLSSPTVATPSVMTIAAKEGRLVIVIDFGGAFLNASLADTGVIVHMRLDKTMTAILLRIMPHYAEYLEANGTMVVQLDKALYRTVEAAVLWYKGLKSTLTEDGFVENAYDVCVLNKLGRDGKQITVTLHVDDLMVTCETEDTLHQLVTLLTKKYKEVTVNEGLILNYLGMTMDFTTEGEVRITMANCVDNILSGCGVMSSAVTPASSWLFDTRDDQVKATESEAEWFHSYVAKMLYLSKRVRPECLTAVAFLSLAPE